MLPTTPPDSLVKRLLHPKEFCTKATEWRQENEPVASQKCVDHQLQTGHTVHTVQSICVIVTFSVIVRINSTSSTSSTYLGGISTVWKLTSHAQTQTIWFTILGNVMGSENRVIFNPTNDSQCGCVEMLFFVLQAPQLQVASHCLLWKEGCSNLLQ